MANSINFQSDMSYQTITPSVDAATCVWHTDLPQDKLHRLCRVSISMDQHDTTRFQVKVFKQREQEWKRAHHAAISFEETRKMFKILNEIKPFLEQCRTRKQPFSRYIRFIRPTIEQSRQECHGYWVVNMSKFRCVEVAYTNFPHADRKQLIFIQIHVYHRRTTKDEFFRVSRCSLTYDEYLHLLDKSDYLLNKLSDTSSERTTHIFSIL